MSTDFELNTKPRDVFGTKASRRLRRLDQVPAMIYGADQNNEAVLLDHNEITRNLGVEAFQWKFLFFCEMSKSVFFLF